MATAKAAARVLLLLETLPRRPSLADGAPTSKHVSVLNSTDCHTDEVLHGIQLEIA